MDLYPALVWIAVLCAQKHTQYIDIFMAGVLLDTEQEIHSCPSGDNMVYTVFKRS